MREYNIWDLEGINVKVKKEFITKINTKIIEKYKIKRELYKRLNMNLPYGVFKNMLKASYYDRWFVPLEFLLKICSELDITREELQSNIIFYKSWGSVNYIKNPKLPILVTPVFHMIYAHNIGDGTVSIAKDRFPYFAYRQFNQFYREAFIEKLEFIFGKIYYNKKEVIDTTRVRCPSVLSGIFFKHYKLNDRGFLSDIARISKLVFDDGKDAMLAVLIGFIIDEGHIDSTQIAVVLKNKELVEDLGKICIKLGYKHTISYKTGEYEGLVGLNILRDGMKKLYADYMILNKKYPVINLGVKGDKIKQSFNIINRPIKRTKGNKEAILDILKKEQLSVNQLTIRINMTRQGVRYHIHNLLKENKIKILDKSQQNWLYGV